MQPILFISAPTDGLLYLNGRSAGEVGPGRPFSAPIAPTGPVYIQFFPIDDAHAVMTRRLALSGGAPVAESLLGQSGLYVVEWPGGAIEAELVPTRARAGDRPPVDIERGDMRLRVAGGRVEIDDGDAVRAFDLPEGALAPHVTRGAAGIYLMGDLEAGGRYLVALSPDAQSVHLALEGDAVAVAEDGAVMLTHALGDVVGRTRVDRYQPGASGYALTGSDMVYTAGTPHIPASPEEVALAAAEAVLLGFEEEALSYLAPDAGEASRQVLEAVAQYDACQPLKWAMADGRTAVGLSRALSEHLVRVEPLLYAASPGGARGWWQLDWLAIGAGRT